MGWRVKPACGLASAARAPLTCWRRYSYRLQRRRGRRRAAVQPVDRRAPGRCSCAPRPRPGADALPPLPDRTAVGNALRANRDRRRVARSTRGADSGSMFLSAPHVAQSPDRATTGGESLLILPERLQDRNAVRAGAAGGRSRRNASNGTTGSRPISKSVMPAGGWRQWMPARKWPAATYRLGQSGTGPRNGKPSGLPGRSPAQQRSTAAPASDGTSSAAKASRPTRRTPWAERRSLRPLPSPRQGPGRRRAARDRAPP